MTNTTTTTAPDLLAAEPIQMDGETVFRVALTGRDGAGEFALLDTDGLDALRLRRAPALYLVGDGKGNHYVAHLRKPSNQAAIASRTVINAPGDRRVRYLNGNRLDLRTANLALTPRKGETPEEMEELKAQCIERRRFSAMMAVRMGRVQWR